MASSTTSKNGICGAYNFFQLNGMLKFNEMIVAIENEESWLEFLNQVGKQCRNLVGKAISIGLGNIASKSKVMKSSLRKELDKFESIIDQTKIEQPPMQELNGFHLLPQVIISNICTFLEHKDAFNSLSKLNRFCYKSLASSDNHVITSIINDSGFMQRQANDWFLHNFISFSARFMRNITRIEIDCNFFHHFVQETSNLYPHLISQHMLPRLQHLKMINAHKVLKVAQYDLLLPNMLQSSELRTIDIQGVRIKEPSQIAKMMKFIGLFGPKISTLIFTNCKIKYVPNAAHILWANMKGLQKIQLKQSNLRLSEYCIKLLPPHQITHLLMHLNIQQNSEKICKALETSLSRKVFSNLKEISINNVPFDRDDKIMKSIINDNNIHSKLSKFEFGFKSESEIQFLLKYMSNTLSAFDNLKYLKLNCGENVSFATKTTDEIVSYFKSNINNRTEFMLELKLDQTNLMMINANYAIQQLIRVLSQNFTHWMFTFQIYASSEYALFKLPMDMKDYYKVYDQDGQEMTQHNDRNVSKIHIVSNKYDNTMNVNCFKI